MAKIIVGIDFGTSTTVVRWRKEDSDEIHEIKDLNNQTVIDSVIFIPDNGGNWIYGGKASARSSGRGKFIRNFKMDLINPDTKDQAILYIRKFMEYVHSRFINQIEAEGINYDSMDIYISYPVKWTIEEKKLMKDIVVDSGFGLHGNIIGMTEPKAAAIDLMRIHIPHLTKTGILKTNNPLKIMMLDMGAGTSDLFIFQLTMKSNGEIVIPEDKIFQYPVSEQSYNCGGREVDEILFKDVVDYLTKGNIEKAKQLYKIEYAKYWKDQVLSDELRGVGLFEGDPLKANDIKENAICEGKWNNSVGEYKMSRNKFENITETHWMNLYRLIENGMAKSKQECKIGTEDIDLIFLTGGHSQWYCVPNLFNGKGINGTIGLSTKHNTLNFSKIINEEWRVLQGTNPQEIVARGLCWTEAIKIPSKAENDIWIQIGVHGIKNNKYSKYKKIVSKGEILPCKINIDNCETEYNTIIYSRDIGEELRWFEIELNIIEGERISKFELPIKDSDFFHEIFTVFASFIKKYIDYKFSYTADISILEDGSLTLSGKLNYDDKKEYCFTDKDLKIL